MSEPSENPRPKKPRRKTQFKPGQSGNPLGRPKCKLDMSVALNKALNDKILVTNIGRFGGNRVCKLDRRCPLPLISSCAGNAQPPAACPADARLNRPIMVRLNAGRDGGS
jgi:hypothetical protein